ncbi:hypothetical protein RINTHM_14270 [Richelia intracellularis HM01]|uniref:KGK domain-containing protein n=1 Tax=Richelia intracellularis TaxID=1164990 RepID=UPI0002B5C3C5|nr:KGK domain-containing protein [Richelia intracellularis]CCH65884.1 hypothetical protein RINTHM_14270 [Richelia intracellularis HM01]
MQNNFISLDSDDVILIDDNAFKVSKLKMLIEQQLQGQLNRRIYNENSLESGASILQTLSNLTLNSNQISLAEMNYLYTNQCQILKINNSGWQKGKINIKVFVSPLQPHTNKVDIVFIPELENAKEYDALLEDMFKILSED